MRQQPPPSQNGGIPKDAVTLLPPPSCTAGRAYCECDLNPNPYPTPQVGLNAIEIQVFRLAVMKHAHRLQRHHHHHHHKHHHKGKPPTKEEEGREEEEEDEDGTKSGAAAVGPEETARLFEETRAFAAAAAAHPPSPPPAAAGPGAGPNVGGGWDALDPEQHRSPRSKMHRMLMEVRAHAPRCKPRAPYSNKKSHVEDASRATDQLFRKRTHIDANGGGGGRQKRKRSPAPAAPFF